MMINSIDDTVIVLSPELQDVAVKMNEVKLDLRLNREQAKSAERRKNDLVMYLAHDLKIPLTSI